ncbi:MAG: hypothetical protein AAGJ68_14050 [Pseudomonadota bacterium]
MKHRRFLLAVTSAFTIAGCDLSIFFEETGGDEETCLELLMGFDFELEKIEQYQTTDNRSYEDFTATDTCREDIEAEIAKVSENSPGRVLYYCPKHPVDILQSMHPLMDLVDRFCSPEEASQARTQHKKLQDLFSGLEQSLEAPNP